MKRKVKSKNFYKNAVKSLRKLGAIEFKVDLRKKISAGKKSAITKAFKVLRYNRNLQFVPIKKEKGESIKKFKKRRTRILDKHGQKRIIKGLFLSVPNDAKLKIKGENIVSEFGDVTEIIIPADPIRLMRSPKKYILSLMKIHNPEIIYFRIGNHKDNQGYDVTPDNMPMGLNELLHDLRNYKKRYKKKFQITGFHFITGLVI